MYVVQPLINGDYISRDQTLGMEKDTYNYLQNVNIHRTFSYRVFGATSATSLLSRSRGDSFPSSAVVRSRLDLAVAPFNQITPFNVIYRWLQLVLASDS